MTSEQVLPTTLFEERQSISWPRYLVLAVVGVFLATFGWGIYRQIVLGKPFGSRPMPDSALILAAAIACAAMAVLAFVVFSAEMRTTVTSDRVDVRYRPFRKRSTPLNEIQSATAFTYRPIREFGGWGLRRSRRGWIYSMSGNRAVELVLADGRRFFIGSLEADTLAAVINRLLGSESS